MANDKIIAANMALAAFYLRDWIAGCETKGSEPPRIVLDAKVDEEGRVDIKYTYPPVCGSTRHTANVTGKEFRETYLRKGNRFLILENGEYTEKLFGGPILDESKEEIFGFCDKFGLDRKSVTA